MSDRYQPSTASSSSDGDVPLLSQVTLAVRSAGASALRVIKKPFIHYTLSSSLRVHAVMCSILHPVPQYICPAGADGTYFSGVILTGPALGLLELCDIRAGSGGACVFLCLSPHMCAPACIHLQVRTQCVCRKR